MASSYPERRPSRYRQVPPSLVFALADQAVRPEIIKKAARSREDVRAFNLLVVDYNLRGSDFFHQDKDLVNAEVAARRIQIEADAKRILAGRAP